MGFYGVMGYLGHVVVAVDGGAKWLNEKNKTRWRRDGIKWLGISKEAGGPLFASLMEEKSFLLEELRRSSHFSYPEFGGQKARKDAETETG